MKENGSGNAINPMHWRGASAPASPVSGSAAGDRQPRPAPERAATGNLNRRWFMMKLKANA